MAEVIKFCEAFLTSAAKEGRSGPADRILASRVQGVRLSCLLAGKRRVPLSLQAPHYGKYRGIISEKALETPKKEKERRERIYHFDINKVNFFFPGYNMDWSASIEGSGVISVKLTA